MVLRILLYWVSPVSGLQKQYMYNRGILKLGISKITLF